VWSGSLRIVQALNDSACRKVSNIGGIRDGTGTSLRDAGYFDYRRHQKRKISRPVMTDSRHTKAGSGYRMRFSLAQNDSFYERAIGKAATSYAKLS